MLLLQEWLEWRLVAVFFLIPLELICQCSYRLQIDI